ncbi:hypothetical protein NE237_012818 [Protea cynaroides]|uniref:MBD domain-containing protein n=1 Tax=Protea cynaroides TaxID=273540 RepID=A0A9Q0H0V1_9MAGN|nr:hypothetical protein NE237_012818 [Protea cynaroides]
MPRQIKRGSRDDETQLVQMEDLPEWLPTGWSMATKTRMSGDRAGEMYKCYIAPATGWKFYSKREVFGYLKTGKPRSRRASVPNKSRASEPNKSHALEPSKTPESEPSKNHGSEPSKSHESELSKSHVSEPSKSHESEPSKSHESEQDKRGIGMHPNESASNVVVEKHTAEGLPPGWIKEMKVTQLAYRTRKDPYYIESVTGFEFRSKKDVFRYLKSGDIAKCKTRPKKRQISDMESIDEETFPPTAAKWHKIAGNATRRSLFTGESSRLSKAAEDKLVLGSSVVEECLPLSWVALGGESSQMINEAHQESEGAKNVEGKMASTEKGFISDPEAKVSLERQSLEKLHSADGESSELISVAKESGGLEDMEGKMVCAEKGLISAPAANVYSGKQPSEKPHDAYGESSELISAARECRGLENTEEIMVCAGKGIISAPAVAVSQEKQLSEKPHSVNRESSELVSVAQQVSGGLENLEKEIVAPSAKISEEKQPLVKSIQKRKNRDQIRTSNSQDGKEPQLARRTSKRLAGLRAELAPNLEMSERAAQMTAKQYVNLEANPALVVNLTSSIHQASKQVYPPEAAGRGVTTPCTSRGSGVLDKNPSKEGEKPPEDPVVEELVRKLENEKQSTERPVSPLVLPFGDSWPDPCLEFAFKTLTGAIPVDDTLVIGNYFQQNPGMGQDQSRSGFTLPDLGSDSFCQTDILFQLGTEKPTAKQQQSQGKHAFTPQGNRGVAASGDSAFHQPYGESSQGKS